MLFGEQALKNTIKYMRLKIFYIHLEASLAEFLNFVRQGMEFIDFFSRILKSNGSETKLVFDRILVSLMS